jgi:hypothetical protein
MSLVAGALIVVALTVAMASPASAATLRPYDQVGGWPGPAHVVVDRSRFVAYANVQGGIVVRDDSRGRSYVTAAPGVIPVALRFPWALVADGPSRILDVERSVFVNADTQPPGPATNGSCIVDPTVSLNKIGSYWLSGACRGAKGPHSAYLNWRTGEWRPPWLVGGSYTRPNLDDPDLGSVPIPTCGLRKPTAYQTTTGWALLSRRSRQTGETVSLRIRPCAGGRAVALSRCRPSCRSELLGPTSVVWVEGTRVASYGLRSRRFRSWSLPAKSATAYVQLKSTRGSVWAVLPSTTKPQLLRGRLP